MYITKKNVEIVGQDFIVVEVVMLMLIISIMILMKPYKIGCEMEKKRIECAISVLANLQD